MVRALLVLLLVAGCKDKAEVPTKVETKAETRTEPPADPSPAARQGLEVKPTESSAAGEKQPSPMAHDAMIKKNIKRVGVDLNAPGMRAQPKKAREVGTAADNHVENKPAKPAEPKP